MGRRRRAWCASCAGQRVLSQTRSNARMSEQVKAIPDGYHSVTAGLVVKDGVKALDFYKAAFGAEVISQMPTPDGKLMHAEFRIGNSIVMLGEECPDWGV